MDAIFSAILEMSVSASVLALLVMLLRPFLKKAPKWMVCALWALVALRLLCPFSLESNISLMPDTRQITQQVISLQPEVSIVDTGEVIPQQNGLTVQIQSDIPEKPFVFRFWMAWAIGVAGMLVYLLVSFLTVRRRVSVFWEEEPGVRQCDNIDTPFIFGLLRPMIYLPSSLPPESRDYVLAHERAHLKRCDHLWKPLGFLLLSLHWFNPVMWLSYILLCRDIELACDEKVIRAMDDSEKTAYSQALLNCSVQQKLVTACPLAFGEVGVKARIKSILSYKKPAFWIILVALLAAIGLGIFFLTDRPEKEPETEIASIEAIVTSTAVSDLLEVQLLDADGSYMLFIRTDGLELPVLHKGDRIFLTYDRSEDLSDGVLSSVIDLGILEEPPIADLERHLEGTVLAVESDYMQVQVSTGSATVNYYVNRKGHAAEPKPGDRVMIHYLPGNDPTKLDQVQDIRIIGQTDSGGASDMTPTELHPTTDLDAAVNQTVRYYISRRLVNPPAPHDKTMEQIPQATSTGFLDDPTTTLTEGKTYEQIAVSHSVIAQEQLGTEYRLVIAACCRGYNNRQAADSLQCSIRLVLRQNEDGAFTATSCMIPTQLSGQADAELLFGQEIAKQLREDWMLWDSLENACDKQVEGGVLTVKGFGRTFAPGSMEASLIENAINAGRKLKKAYEDGYVSTLFLGDTVYYFYFNAGIIHNATDDLYTQLTKEGTQTINTIFQATDEE